MGSCASSSEGGCISMSSSTDKTLHDLIPQAVEKPLGPADGKDDSALTRGIRSKTFYVAKGMSFDDLFKFKNMEEYFQDVEDWKHVITDWLGAQSLSVNTRDGRKLDALWLETPPASDNAAVVLFHANCAIAIDMALWGSWYRQRGLSVLMITMGGYAGSETTELSTYFDADAAVHFLLHRGIPTTRMLVHGLSIGGALAANVAAQHAGVSATLDQTFVNAAEVAATTTLLISKHVPDFAINSVVDTCFPKGLTDPRLPGVFTDAYNTESKLAKIQGHYFVIWAENDHMMPSDFAERLFGGYYKPLVKACVDADHENAEWTKDRVIRCSIIMGVDPDIIQAGNMEDCCTELRKKAAAMSKDDHSLALGIEELALKRSCRIPNGPISSFELFELLAGEHGSFFGDDDICSMNYEAHLRELGFVRRDFYGIG